MSRTALALLLIVLLTSTSCSTGDRTTGTLIGAGAGAGIGALAAGSGAVAWGAAIGAGAGALAGYFIADWIKAPEPAPGQAISAEARAQSEAEAYFRQAQFSRQAADSEYYLQRSLALHPTPAACNNLALLYLQHGDKPRAREYWQKALTLDSNYRPAQENLKRLG